MSKKIIPAIIILISLFYAKNIQAQILYDMGNFRNVAYTAFGYTGAFENNTIGVARRDYVKLLKKEVIGILDLSLPLTRQFFTRHALRKGFQLDLYQKNNMKIPFMFASTSIVRENKYVKYHDITAELGVAPGFYAPKYSLALDLRYEIILFRLTKYTPLYLQDINPEAKRHWEEPYYSIAKLGVMGAINLNRFVISIRTGYERNPTHNKKQVPLYINLGFGIKFGSKPFK